MKRKGGHLDRHVYTKKACKSSNFSYTGLPLHTKVLGELCELKIKALLPTLTLGLSLVNVFCMLSCDWPRDQQGTSKIMIAAFIMIFTVANIYFTFYTQKTPATLEMLYPATYIR